jgi:DNA-binding NtrC family response regulator
MGVIYTVLVTATTPAISRRLESSVRAAGHRPFVVTTFETAKRVLQSHPRPDLVISEIKLGEYNGLHLAVRSQFAGIPAIVVGEDAFKCEAEQLGAIFCAPRDVNAITMRTAIARSIELAQATQSEFAWYSGDFIPSDTVSDVDFATLFDAGSLNTTLH